LFVEKAGKIVRILHSNAGSKIQAVAWAAGGRVFQESIILPKLLSHQQIGLYDITVPFSVAAAV
jgi:hypothetical protein